MDAFITQLPKVELLIHIEGTLEPELALKLAERNQQRLPYSTPEQFAQACQFNNLKEFLSLYYQATSVLQKAEDFYELAMAYFHRCEQEKILHHEISFDPQVHLRRGISMATMLDGLIGAQLDAKARYGATGGLILSLLRHLPESDAIETLCQAKPWQHLILGVGLDSSELSNPPQKFKRAYELANEFGWHRVAHAGEEGPADYIWGALHELNARRIHHGIRAVEDPCLLDYLAEKQIPLALSPHYLLKLGHSVEQLNQHIRTLLEHGVCITINSDDPAYFGGYLSQNMQTLQNSLQLTQSQWVQLTENSIKASFAPMERKQALNQRLQRFLTEHREHQAICTRY